MLRVALAEQRLQTTECAQYARRVQLAFRGDLTGWRGRIDDVRQDLRQQSRDLIGLHASLGRKVGDGIRAEHAMQRVCGDGLILAVADPRTDDVASAFVLELLDQAIQAARLVIDELKRGAEKGLLSAAALGRLAEQGTKCIE